MRAFNLLTDVELYFDELTTPEWAVAYGYCVDHGLTSALFASLADRRFPEFFKTLPVTRGARSIACGDWATTLRD